MPDFSLSLNPTGLLARMFGQDVRRPNPPQWVPTGRQAGAMGAEGSVPSQFTWDWYRYQVELSQERLDLYRDYDEMDQDDLIASVLDAIAEDATQRDFMTDRVVWCESKNPAIEDHCHGVLDRLTADEGCGGQIREIAKYGDCFEFLYSQRGSGVVSREYVQPHIVWRYERQGKLAGFNVSEEPRPEPESLTLPWQFCHFMRTGGRRYPGVQYGDSWIRPARRLYRKLQMTEDAMIMYRIRRAPDRDVYYIDVGDSPPDQQVAIVKMWKRLFKKNISYDPASGILRGEINPLAYDEDIFWPTKEGNNSRVERLSGSANVGDIFDVEFLVNRLFSALRAPKDYFGFGDSGAFDRGKGLEQQDIRWARGIKGLQQSCTRGWAHILKIDMALRGIDPEAQGNEFVIKMSPVSALDELQRADLYDARLRSMEGLTRVVADLEGLDKKAWFRFLLTKFGGFREGFFDKFISQAKKDADKGVPGAGSFGLDGESLSAREERFLIEAMPKGMGYHLHSILSNGTPSSAVRERLPKLRNVA